MNHRLNACAVIFASDVSRVRDFYRQLVRMEVLTEDAEHAVMAIPGFELVIHKLYGEPSSVDDDHDQELVREDSYIKLCFPVDSLESARNLAESLGGSIQGKSKEWQARGFLACDGRDPEGNVIQLRQMIEPQGV